MARYRRSRNPVLELIMAGVVMVICIIIFIANTISTSIENTPDNIIKKDVTYNNQTIKLKIEDHGEGYQLSDDMKITNTKGQEMTFIFTTIDAAKEKYKEYNSLDTKEKDYTPGGFSDPNIYASFKTSQSGKLFSTFEITRDNQKYYVCAGQIANSNIGFYISETITDESFLMHVLQDVHLSIKK